MPIVLEARLVWLLAYLLGMLAAWVQYPLMAVMVYLVLQPGSQHWDYVSLMNHRIMLTATHLNLGCKRTKDDDKHPGSDQYWPSLVTALPWKG